MSNLQKLIDFDLIVKDPSDSMYLNSICDALLDYKQIRMIDQYRGERILSKDDAEYVLYLGDSIIYFVIIDDIWLQIGVVKKLSGWAQIDSISISDHVSLRFQLGDAAIFDKIKIKLGIYFKRMVIFIRHLRRRRFKLRPGQINRINSPRFI